MLNFNFLDYVNPKPDSSPEPNQKFSIIVRENVRGKGTLWIHFQDLIICLVMAILDI